MHSQAMACLLSPRFFSPAKYDLVNGFQQNNQPTKTALSQFMVDSNNQKVFQFIAAYICPLGSRRGLFHMIKAEPAMSSPVHPSPVCRKQVLLEFLSSQSLGGWRGSFLHLGDFFHEFDTGRCDAQQESFGDIVLTSWKFRNYTNYQKLYMLLPRHMETR